MPVYFFTFHAYRSWMPDHPRGYVKRKEEVLPPDPEMAKRYEARANHEPAVFTAEIEKELIDEVLIWSRATGIHVYAIGTEPSHIHSLTSWSSDRTAISVRTSLKTSLSRRLSDMSKHIGFRVALSRGGDSTHVKDRSHFDHIMTEYVPKHRGLRWIEGRRFLPWVES